MTFVLFKIAWALLRPGNLAALALVAGVVLAAFGGRFWRRLGQGLVVAVAVFFLALTVLPLGSWVTAPLEERVPPAALPDRVAGIVILGGAILSAKVPLHRPVSVNEEGERLLVGLELARRYPEAKVVYSGGSGLAVVTAGREADGARRIFAGIGFSGPRFVFERNSRNTRENATMSKALVDPRPGESWVLLTSAAHMPRALAVFEAAGWPAMLPYPVDYRTGGAADPIADFGFEEELGLLEYGLREWMGLAAYYLRGWTNSFWPKDAAAQGASG